MEQCPVCMRVFASSNYLVSHLHQSACRSALFPTDHGMVSALPTNTSTFDGISNSSIRNGEVPPQNDVVNRPMSTNAFGDIIIASDDDNSDGFPCFDKSEDSEDNDPPAMPRELPHIDQNTTDSGQQPSESTHSPNPISIILEHESFNVPIGSDDKLIPMLKMIKAVGTAGAPLCLLDTLVKIIKEEWQVGRMDITNLCTHKTAIRRISKMFPSLPTPISVSVTHERTVNEMNIGAARPSLTFPKFSFLGQLQDLLDDHVFSDLNNLVVDPENRWEYYKPNSCPHSADEIQDGHWFQSIIHKVQGYPPSDSIKNFVIGIQGYVDKTGTDAYQRTAVEPLVFTLTLFTNEIRNSDKYWRVLALLPASLCQKQSKKHSFGASVRNYHIALREAFRDFIDLQKKPPIVRLRLGDQFQYVRAHLFWVNTIADGLANESLTGRIQNRNSSPRLSRGCHCPQHLADNSNLTCNYLRQSAVERLCVAALGPANDETGAWNNYVESLNSSKEKRAAETVLKTRKKIAQAILKNVFGQHVVDLVWFHVDQGPNPRGCFGSTPVDPMHAVEEGIIPNIMSVILDPLPDSAKSGLDALALKIVACNRWDSDYPRMNFTGGFCSLTQLTADEKVGKMMLLWIIMQTTLGREIIEKRCSTTFDAQRLARAARFNPNTTNNQDDKSESEEIDSLNESSTTITDRQYTGTPVQIDIVNKVLQDHQLHFVVPWLDEMIPFHQEILRKTVFQINFAQGKGLKHKLPQDTFLDRHVVHADTPLLYYTEDPEPRRAQSTTEAQFSIDCTIDQLQSLLEMILSFHASYKYAHVGDRRNFETNVRLMMARIKQQINRGIETQNWSISKFHDLLHMVEDAKEFGSHSNIDAGKGEQGLKKWAKLPSKTVRTRDANHYYHDVATRIYETRLIELASSTLMPRSALTSQVTNAEASHPEVNDHETVTVTLSNVLTRLEVIGPTHLQPELTAYLRSRPNLVFPIEIYTEAKYVANGGQHTTIRGTPNYRNSGPWYDCVLVTYEDDDGTKKEYPFQVHGFFTEAGQRTQSAVGRMGMRKKRMSRLLDEWTYEKQYRIVDLQTTSQVVFALTMPMSCYKEGSADMPHRLYVMKDRISEWPVIFDESNWTDDNKSNENKRKRKGRN
jgi:hypothetical protein